MSERWYQDPRLLKAAYKEYGSFPAIVENVGGADQSTLSRWYKRHGFRPLSHGPNPKSDINITALNKLKKEIYG